MIRTRSVFVHICKAAGVSVQQSLYGNLGAGHLGIADYQRLFTDGFVERAFVFTVVRNPWDRIHAAYQFLRQGGWPQWDGPFHDQIADCRSFEHFVLEYLHLKRIRAIPHFRQTINQLRDRDGNFFPFDFIGRFCRLDADFAEIARHVRPGAQLKRLNVTPGSRPMGYVDAYTPEMIDVVARYYAETIDALGYWFDGFAVEVPALENLRRAA